MKTQTHTLDLSTAFRLEPFRLRGLIIVLTLCGIFAGVCTVLSNTSRQARSAAMEQQASADQYQDQAKAALQ
jgi:F0F1-type ATP synthase assembly protein I